MGDLDPIAFMISWAILRSQSKGHDDWFSCFHTGDTTECPYTLRWDAPFPLKITPSNWGAWTPSNTWFPGPTRVLNPNGISIGSAVFAGLTSVTDRPTDRQTTLLGG